MSQDPLARIRRRGSAPVVRERPTFPQEDYRSTLLQPDAERWAVGTPRHAALQTVAQAHLIQLAEQRILSVELAAEGLRHLPHAAAQRTWQHPVLDQLAAASDATQGGVLLGTSTEELSALVARLVVRDALLDLHAAMLDLRETLSALASGHLTTLMLLTLDGQATQPSTLAHLVTAWIDALTRDGERLQQLWERVNLAPAGAVMGISTALPIQRSRLATLLGFPGVITHTLDALAGDDWLLEVSTNAALLAGTLQRSLQTLQHLARADVGLLVPEDAYLHSDPALPQLREPRVLTALAQRVSDVSAASADLLRQPASGDALGSRATREHQLTAVLSQLDTLRSCLHLLREMVQHALVNRAMFANRANRGFTTSAELLDLLVQDYHYTRATALELLNRIVVEATERGLEAATLRTALVDELALKVIGDELGIEEETLAAVLAPKRVIERRTMEGGPAATQVRHALERHGFRLRREREWQAQQRDTRDRALLALEQRVSAGIADPQTLLRQRRRRSDVDDVDANEDPGAPTQTPAPSPFPPA